LAVKRFFSLFNFFSSGIYSAEKSAAPDNQQTDIQNIKNGWACQAPNHFYI